MTEWIVVEVIIALVGLLAVLVKPMINLTAAITELTITVKSVKTEFEEFKAHNHESHKSLWDHNKRQDDQIADHEQRIQLIENRKDD